MTSTLDDGTVQKNMADGGVQRFNPTTGATTYTTPEGGDFVTRENPDGSLVVQDPLGMVTESNPTTGKTAVTFPDGSAQQTMRDADGSLATSMSDGTQVTTAPNGAMTFVDAEGKEFGAVVNEDGSMLTNTPEAWPCSALSTMRAC